MFVSQSKQAAEVVLRIPDSVRAFALDKKRVFDQTVERGEGLMIGRRMTVLGIGAVQRLSQDADSGLHIFTGISGKSGGELLIEFSEYHSTTLIQNFLVI
jgi:hypothetical protein